MTEKRKLKTKLEDIRISKELHEKLISLDKGEGIRFVLGKSKKDIILKRIK